MPLYNKLKDKTKYTWTVINSMIVVVILMLCMGFFGYLAFGKNIQPSITLNLPETKYFCIFIYLNF